MPADGLHPSRPVPVSHPLRTRVWSAGRLLLLAAALTLTFGAFFLTGMRVANRAREVTVPDLRGQAMADAELRKTLLGVAIEPQHSTPEEFAAIIREQLPKWAKIVKEAGVRID